MDEIDNNECGNGGNSDSYYPNVEWFQDYLRLASTQVVERNR
jgi:hypothetical protein